MHMMSIFAVQRSMNGTEGKNRTMQKVTFAIPLSDSDSEEGMRIDLLPDIINRVSENA